MTAHHFCLNICKKCMSCNEGPTNYFNVQTWVLQREVIIQYVVFINNPCACLSHILTWAAAGKQDITLTGQADTSNIHRLNVTVSL